MAVDVWCYEYDDRRKQSDEEKVVSFIFYLFYCRLSLASEHRQLFND
jgi:hypothetical protein